jgi:hypothetical protein
MKSFHTRGEQRDGCMIVPFLNQKGDPGLDELMTLTDWKKL